ncbi:MAG: ATP-binding cassette domain-containing protein, partial [Thermodesulfobacteriales bacterium]
MTELIKLENVAIGYEQGPFVDLINLSIEKNQFWGVLGPNGSGKTTLLKTILNLISPASGTVFFHNELVFGYVPQNEKFDPIFPISVCEMVSMGRYSRVKPGRRLSKKDNEIVERSIESVGISHLKDRTFRSL